MASAGPKVPLIAPQLYMHGARAQPRGTLGQGASSIGTSPGRQNPLGQSSFGGQPQALAATPGAPGGQLQQRSRVPEVPLGARGPAPVAGASPPTGPQARQAQEFTPKLKRGIGGVLSQEASVATTYAPPPDSSLPTINIPAPAQADSEQETAAPSEQQQAAEAQQEPTESTRQNPNNGQRWYSDEADTEVTDELGPHSSRPRTRQELGGVGFTGGRTESGNPVYEDDNGHYFFTEDGESWFEVLPENVDFGGDAANPNKDHRDAGEKARDRGYQDSHESEVGTTTSGLTPGGQQANGQQPGQGQGVGTSSRALVPGGQQSNGGAPAQSQAQPGQNQGAGQGQRGQGQVSGQAQRAAQRSGQDPYLIQTLLDRGVSPSSITNEGFTVTYPDGDSDTFGWYDNDDRYNAFITDAKSAAAQKRLSDQGNGESGKQQGQVDERLKAIMDNAPPEMDQAALENMIGAERQQNAWNQSRALRASMGRSAALGMSPEGSLGIGNELAGNFNTQQNTLEAQQRFQAAQQNFQAQMAHYNSKQQALSMLLAQAVSAQDRATIQAVMAQNAAAMQRLQQDGEQFSYYLNAPGAGQQALDIAGGVLSGGATVLGSYAGK